MACVRTSITAVVDFTTEFADRYREAKEERQIAEFSDVAHRALEILVSKEGKTEKYTHVADELSELYDEIYIDEYQDSNYVQEKILNAVSRCRFGCNNIFMVGDVKQSIYRFRMARPEIFIDKYNTYTEEQSPERKIELHKNFRSTVNVINSVNDIFRRIMKKALVILNIMMTQHSITVEISRMRLTPTRIYVCMSKKVTIITMIPRA